MRLHQKSYPMNHRQSCLLQRKLFLHRMHNRPTKWPVILSCHTNVCDLSQSRTLYRPDRKLVVLRNPCL